MKKNKINPEECLCDGEVSEVKDMGDTFVKGGSRLYRETCALCGKFHWVYIKSDGTVWEAED